MQTLIHILAAYGALSAVCTLVFFGWCFFVVCGSRSRLPHASAFDGVESPRRVG